jgi:hypothetical protein
MTTIRMHLITIASSMQEMGNRAGFDPINICEGKQYDNPLFKLNFAVQLLKVSNYIINIKMY